MSMPMKSPEQLKVAELREELKKRGIPTKGLKKDLVEKLEAALLAESNAIAAQVQAAAETRSTTITDVTPEGDGATMVTQLASQEVVPQEPLEPLVPEAAKLVAEPAREAEPVVDAGKVAAEVDARVDAGTEVDAGVDAGKVGQGLSTVDAAAVEAEGEGSKTVANAENTVVLEDVEIVKPASIEEVPELMKDANVVEEPAAMVDAAPVEAMDVAPVEEPAVTTGETVVVTTETMVEKVVETVTENRDGEVTETTTVTETVEEMVKVVEEPKVDAPAEVEAEPTASLVAENSVPEVEAGKDIHREDSVNARVIGDVEMEKVDEKTVDSDKTTESENGEVTKAEVEAENKAEVEAENGNKVGEAAAAAAMDVDAEAQAGLKRKEYEEEQPVDQNKRQRRWNTGKDEAADGTGVATGGKSSGTRLADRLSRPLVSPSSDTPNNGRGNVTQTIKNPTTSLKIERFVRPFTLKALKDLLAETGDFSDFWIDNIKTHCYVTYSSVDQAVATRNALNSRRWPLIHGQELNCEFVEPEEVKRKCESGDKQTPNVSISLPRGGVGAPLTSPHTPSSPYPAPTPTPREKQNLQKREPEPIITLDDLFKKTAAKPSIYYLPLTDEEVEAKKAAKA